MEHFERENEMDQGRKEGVVESLLIDTDETAAQSAPTESTAEVEWYSVSYPAQTPPEEKKKTRKKGAFVALALAACLTFSCVGALVGGFLFDRLKGAYDDVGTREELELDSQNGGTQNGNTQNGGTGTSNGGNSNLNQGETPNPNTDSNYDFAAAYAALQKNDGTGLAGSANGSAGDAAKSLIEVTAAVKDSVVEITTTTVSNRGAIYAGAGSGVIIHADGIIVTNNHVIEDCDEIVVRLTNGETYEATLRGTDKDGDIAIIKITPRAESPLTVAKLGCSASLALGEEVIAIGNPLGELGGTVTNGIISATEREIKVDGYAMKLLQTNAAINSGNSGGGLFNMAGELIGVVNAKYAATGVEGLGFAIPIDTAYATSFADLFTYGYMRGVPSLGVKLVEHTGSSFFTTYYGACVTDAGSTSLLVDDYIYSINGTVVYFVENSALDAIHNVLRTCNVGDTVSVVVLRGTQKTEVTLSVTLVEYVPDTNG